MQSSGNGHRYRIWFVVAPREGKWEVSFACDANPYLYATREEAQVVARSAARLHFEDQGDPTGAYVELPGQPRQVLATYGRPAQAAAPRERLVSNSR